MVNNMVKYNEISRILWIKSILTICFIIIFLYEWLKQPIFMNINNKNYNNKRIALVIHEHIPIYTSYGSDKRLMSIIKDIQRNNYSVIFIGRTTVGIYEHKQLLEDMNINYLIPIINKMDMIKFIQQQLHIQIDVIIMTLWFWRKEPLPIYFEEMLNKYYSHIPIILISDDCHYNRENQLVHSSRKHIIYQQEMQAYKIANYVLTISDNDRHCMIKEYIYHKFNNTSIMQFISNYIQLSTKKFHILPYSIPNDMLNLDMINTVSLTFKDRNHILFLGNNDNPLNRMGIEWFVENILYKFKERISSKSIKLYIVGQLPSKGRWSTTMIKAIKSNDVQLLGYISNEKLTHLMGTIKVFVVPIFQKSGLRTKLTVALLHGLPIITTDAATFGLGIQGTKIENNQNIVIIVNTIEDWINKLVSLYTNESKWNSYHNNSFQYARKVLIPNKTSSVLTDILQNQILCY